MKAQIVSFHCVLKNKLGQVLSSSFNHDVINQLDEHDSTLTASRLRGLVAGIQNVHAGEKRHFTVPAHEAYGLYDPELVLNVRRSQIDPAKTLSVGSEIMGRSGPDGQPKVYRVVRNEGENVVLDGNHPLAGQDLVFDIEVISARDASSDDFDIPSGSGPATHLH